MQAALDLDSDQLKVSPRRDAANDNDALLEVFNCLPGQRRCSSGMRMHRWLIMTGSIAVSFGLCLLFLCNIRTSSSLMGSSHVESEGAIESLAAVNGCGASTEDTCLPLAGCVWFEVSQPCVACKQWVHDIDSLTGCRDWNPDNYCKDQIYFGLLVKSGIKDPRNPIFQDAVRHFHVVVGAGKTGKIEHVCNVVCDAVHCAPQVQVGSVPIVHAATVTDAKPQCGADTKDDCLESPGCRWFEIREPCKLCKDWAGDVEKVTGCRDWNPYDFCGDQIFWHLLDKSPAAKAAGPRSAEFIDAVRHFEVTQGRGSIGGPQGKTFFCDVWCDSMDCEGQARVNSSSLIRGLNYGGRFVPEEFLGLNGTGEYLFKDINKSIDARVITPCDISAPDAGERVARFLDENIKREHFHIMAHQGFDTLRLPMGYWNLIDIDGTPDGPPDVKARWSNLQGFMKAQDYRKWIDKVFNFANESGLKVLMDLHSAPGGQSGNECTGCDQGPTDAIFFFGESQGNINHAVQAVKVMAEICAEKGDVCYGIELLNEPHNADRDTKHSEGIMQDLAKCKVIDKPCNGLKFMFNAPQIKNPEELIGEFFLSMVSNKTVSPIVQTNYRQLLRGFYVKAIKAARMHMDDDKPIVVMDWPAWLEWWQDNGKFSYHDFGRIVFSTHVYDFGLTASVQDAQKKMLRPLDILRNFTLKSGYDLLVTEYALNSHGSGQDGDMFDYNSFADWYVHQLSQVGIGSMIWNFDSYWSAWGSIASNTVGNSQMTWPAINAMFGDASIPGVSGAKVHGSQGHWACVMQTDEKAGCCGQCAIFGFSLLVLNFLW